MKLWQDEIKQAEQMRTHARHARDDPHNQIVMKDVCQETSNSVNFSGDYGLSVVPKTMVNPDIQILGDFDGKVVQVIEQFKLNQKQQFAFHIGAQRFKELLDIDVSSWNGTIGRGKPLHMLMIGTGGTGKTHVVKALKELMKLYGCAHQIRFLAPTGSAAALIDGQTIHSALGIPVHLTNAERRDLRDSNGADLYMKVSVKRRAELREEWKNVYFLLIDEVSMVSQELLCEIDIVLRDVASCPNEWFGGVNIIFAGDFYQHKPVKQCALYSPIPSKPNKIYTQMEDVARYGRLVWKSVESVIELTEQKRMQEDPEYAQACQHLRIHKCDFDDMKIFNSCLIKSPSNPLGVHLKTFPESTIIVHWNITHQHLNQVKADSLTSSSVLPELLKCTAWHTIGKKIVTAEVQNHLEQISTSDGLPPHLDFYIGAPVVLRNRNLSQELRITNASQGIVRCIL